MTAEGRRKLESRLAGLFGREHVLLTGRATTAIYLALKGSGAKDGSVILPDVLCPSPANAALYAGLRPAFCDVELGDYNMSARTLEAAMGSDAKAVVPVHLFGQPADMAGICDLAGDRGAMVIEDVAQAFGGRLGNRMLGSFGDVSVLSFGKILGDGDGGAVMTDSKILAAKMAEALKKVKAKPENLAAQYDEYKKYYYAAAAVQDPAEKRRRFLAMPGLYSDLYLYRFTDGNLARVNAALDGLDENLAARRRNAALYRKLLVHPDILHPAYDWDSGTFYRYSILLTRGRKEATDGLRRRGFDASNLYYVPLHDIYESPADSAELAPNTMAVSSGILNVWVEPRITEEYVRGACAAILDALGRPRIN